MAYIVAKLSGEKKRGGFLSIDGNPETELFDGTILKVTAGAHHLSFSSQSAVVKAGKDLIGIFTDGASDDIATAKNYDMDINFEPNTVMLIDVSSDSLGRIAGAPDCQMTNADDAKIRELEMIYQDTINGSITQSEPEEKELAGTYNKLMLISVLTFFTVLIPAICGIIGWIKQVKFMNHYGYKPKHSGLQGFVSLLCAVGGIVVITQFL